jgi:hypothetical protein
LWQCAWHLYWFDVHKKTTTLPFWHCSKVI